MRAPGVTRLAVVAYLAVILQVPTVTTQVPTVTLTVPTVTARFKVTWKTPRLLLYSQTVQCNGGGYKEEYTCNEGLRVGSWGSWLWQEDISYVWLHIHQVLYFCAFLLVGVCMYISQ